MPRFGVSPKVGAPFALRHRTPSGPGVIFVPKSSLKDSAIRRLPIGAEPQRKGVHFRVWAPRCRSVQVVFRGRPLPEVELGSDGNGYFASLVPEAEPGMGYSLRLDDDGSLHSDPASRFQPDGPQGVSRIVDSGCYEWRDATWPGLRLRNQVLYEMHVGTFTPQGTWKAAADQLAELAALGVTALELMPITEFPGKFGWSYDGTHLFAPSHCYGTPDDFRHFVDVAHQVGLGVLLDVVYNHWSRIGEEVVRPFSDAYISKRYKNDWGAAVNFDDDGSASVREFFLANVRHWIAEYHVDGLRIDATQAICDRSPRNILLELSRDRAQAAEGRGVLVIGENEPQLASLLRPEKQEGCELDALWNDDFHHTAMVRLTGRSEAYYTDYHGTAEEMVAGVQWGFLFQGQRYAWQDKPRGGAALDIAAPRFINFLQNHDQLANSARGLRIHELTSPGRYRAMTALLLLAPQTPLLFQGQEFAASSPFLYFNDLAGEECATGRPRKGRVFKTISVARPSGRATASARTFAGRKFRALQARLRRARRAMPRVIGCIEICCGFVDRIPCLPNTTPNGSAASHSRATSSYCDSCRPTEILVCWSSTWAPTWTEPRWRNR